MRLTKDERDAFRTVVLLYDEPGLSHSLVKLADLLPLVFDNFPHAEVWVYNNANSIAGLWQAPAGRVLRVLPVLPRLSSREPAPDCGPDVVHQTLTLRFRKSFDSIDIRDQVHGPTIFFHTFGNHKDSWQQKGEKIEQRQKIEKMRQTAKIEEIEKIDVYHLQGQAAVHVCLPVTGRTIRYKQQEILAALGFDGVRPGAPGAVLDEARFSPQLKKQIQVYQAQYPELSGRRPVVLANILKKMDGLWLHDGESAYSIKARWLLALEKIVRHLPVTLILNEGPQEWRDHKARPFPAYARTPASSMSSTAPVWQTRTAREEIVSLYDSLRGIRDGKARLLQLNEESITVVRLAALLHVTKKSGGALLDVHTGSSHLAEWMQTPEVLEHSYYAGQETGRRSNLKRVLTPFFEISRNEADQLPEMRGYVSIAEREQFANDVVAAVRELIAVDRRSCCL